MTGGLTYPSAAGVGGATAGGVGARGPKQGSVTIIVMFNLLLVTSCSVWCKLLPP